MIHFFWQSTQHWHWPLSRWSDQDTWLGNESRVTISAVLDIEPRWLIFFNKFRPHSTSEFWVYIVPWILQGLPMMVPLFPCSLSILLLRGFRTWVYETNVNKLFPAMRTRTNNEHLEYIFFCIGSGGRLSLLWTTDEGSLQQLVVNIPLLSYYQGFIGPRSQLVDK